MKLQYFVFRIKKYPSYFHCQIKQQRHKLQYNYKLVNKPTLPYLSPQNYSEPNIRTRLEGKRRREASNLSLREKKAFPLENEMTILVLKTLLSAICKIA